MSGMFELKEFGTFKNHLRDFLVQTKQFASQDNSQLFAEDVERELQAQKANEVQRLAAVPGLVAGTADGDGMADS